jgi:hypothetical protein
MSSVLWGFLGQADGFPEIGYGIRAYLEGILDIVRQNLTSKSNGSQNDATMAFRRHLVIRGVLSHMSLETYRQLTSVYEDKKEVENGSLWVDGHLNLPKD